MPSEHVLSLYSKASSLKALLGNNKGKDISSDPETWRIQQELQSVFKELLITDLSYSVSKKVDVDLWNYGFKDYIAYLQSLKDGSGALPTAFRNPFMKAKLQKQQTTEAQVTLTWFLDMATGFYMMLLENIRYAYDLDYPFLRRPETFGIIRRSKKSAKSCASRTEEEKIAHENDCSYILQHCLVHLGDLARYRNQIKQAEAFYRQAILCSPSSGQAYNQIALLEATRGNKLTSTFFYVRSLSVKYPFPAASNNLMKIIERFVSNPCTKITNSSTFIHQFLRLLGLLRHLLKLKTCLKIVKDLNDSGASLIATESIQTWHLIQILGIILFQMESARESLSYASLDEKIISAISHEFLSGLLVSVLLPIYTVKPGGESLLFYFALPVLKLILDWIIERPDVLKHPRFKKRPQIWPAFVQMMNQLTCIFKEEDDVEETDQENYPLPEDYDLQGFLPLYKSLSAYDFSKICCRGYLDEDGEDNVSSRSICLLRARRLIRLGIRLSEQSNPVVTYDVDKGFASVNLQQENNEEEEEDFLINLEGSEDDKESFDEDDSTPEILDESTGSVTGGILKINKPSDRIISPPSSSKPASNNVAMNAILKQAQQGDKTVTFRTPSPKVQDNPIILPNMSMPPPPRRLSPEIPYGSSLFGGYGGMSQEVPPRTYTLFGSPWPQDHLNRPPMSVPPPVVHPYPTAPPPSFTPFYDAKLFQGGPSPLEKLIQQQRKS